MDIHICSHVFLCPYSQILGLGCDSVYCSQACHILTTRSYGHTYSHTFLCPYSQILGLGCEHTNSEQCSPFALHYNCTPKYEVTSVNELAGKIVNATTEIYYGIVGYNKFRIDALNNSPTGALSPSDFVSTIKFRRFCVPDGQPIVLPQCV